MAKVMAYLAMSPGHLYPFLAVLTELRRRGHHVVMATNADRNVSEEVAGIAVFALPWNFGGEGRSAGAPILSAGHVVTASEFAKRGEPIALTLEHLVSTEQPDFLLIDPMFWGGVIAAESSGLPWATLAHNPVTFRGRGIDVRGPGIPPPHGFLSRLRYRVLWGAMRTVDDGYLPEINQCRMLRGLTPLSHAWDLYFQPPLTIATTAEPFEYPRSDWPLSIRFVGPLIWEPSMPTPHWIEDLDERPIVLLVGPTQKGSNETESWTSVALAALADEPVQVIATLPTETIPEGVFGNARIARFIPHGLLLPRAACVVCHGGWGVTQKALAAGVPVVAIPSGYDRFEVARRVETAAAGVMLSERRLSPSRLRSAIREAMNHRDGAARVADLFQRTGGPGAAADSVEMLLG
jgi:MGT family glycosyltransferase